MPDPLRQDSSTELISVVVPCFNEEDVIEETHRQLVAAMEQSGTDFELVYVDDGSADRTPALLRDLQSRDGRVRVVLLSRNFGHQVATTAGLDHASGDAVALIDADLQDPPEVILEMLAKRREGWDVVYGVRRARDGETAFKLATAKAFYRVINWMSSTRIPPDTGDFRLMDRRVVEALRAMPERDRFLRGMVCWVGFRQTSVYYQRAARFAGSSKYPVRKMMQFAVDGMLSFSTLPLRLATATGFCASIVGLAGGAYALLARLLTNHWVAGWTSIFLAVMFMGGVQLICLGIIGEYMGRTYGEAKHRPLYFVQDVLGFTESPAPTLRMMDPSAERTVHRSAAR